MKNINKIKPDKNKNPDTSNQEGNLAKTVCGFIESKNLGNVLHMNTSYLINLLY